MAGHVLPSPGGPSLMGDPPAQGTLLAHGEEGSSPQQTQQPGHVPRSVIQDLEGGRVRSRSSVLKRPEASDNPHAFQSESELRGWPPKPGHQSRIPPVELFFFPKHHCYIRVRAACPWFPPRAVGAEGTGGRTLVLTEETTRRSAEGKGACLGSSREMLY